MTSDYPLGDVTLSMLRGVAPEMQDVAMKHPLEPSGRNMVRYQWHWAAGQRTGLASMSVESCGCLSETPLWHVSVSVWSKLGVKVNDPAAALAAAEALLHGVGSEDSLWYWHDVPVLIGHLRSHLTTGEAQHVPDHQAGSEDHEEDGEWYKRRLS